MADIYLAAGNQDLSSTGIASGDALFVVEGAQEVTNGGTIPTTGDLTRVYEGPASNVKFPSTNPLRCDVDTGTTIMERWGSGRWHVYPGGASGIITKLQQMGKGTTSLVTGGTVTNAEVHDGKLEIASAVAATNVYQNGGIIDQVYAATGNTNWFISGTGQFLTGRGFSGTAVIGGKADVLVRKPNTAGSSLPAGVTMYIVSGRVKWMGGNITTVYVFDDGILDLSEAPGAACTITTLNITATARKRSILESRLNAVVITTTNEFIGRSATFGIPGAFAQIGFGGTSMSAA